MISERWTPPSARERRQKEGSDERQDDRAVLGLYYGDICVSECMMACAVAETGMGIRYQERR